MAVPSQAWTDPSQGVHHNSHFTLQKYLLLQEQHESLHQHLEQLRPPPPASTSARASPLGSPTRPTYGSGYGYGYDASPFSSRASSTSRNHSRSRRGSTPGPPPPLAAFGLETVLDESTLAAVAAEEAKLFDVNEGIKRVLTELLNCDTVRADTAMRTWVQRRLMDAEKELRVGRRRRSGAGHEYGY